MDDVQDHIAHERKRTEKAVLRRIKRLKKSISIRQEELAECRLQQDFENKGNLLSCNFANMKKGMRHIVVKNLFDDEKEIEIPLDAKKSPQQNIAFYFAKVKKLQRREIVLPGVITQMEQELDRWCLLLNTIPQILSREELVRMQHEQHLLMKPVVVEERSKKISFHTFFSETGYAILVGKDASSNDMLTFQKAAGDDIWLHAHGCPGSHVVIRKNNAVDIDRATLLDAMQLALYFSKRRSAPHVLHEVLYCKRRYIKKRKGAPAGEVMVAGGKIEAIVLDPNRVAAIKKNA
jgi:predicted ribosome quality control (RQC) complex YloA/Tae2 family protein